jgi:hypothetical protein
MRRSSLLHVLAFWSENMPSMLDTVESPKSKQSLVGLLLDILWDHGHLPSNRSVWLVNLLNPERHLC